VIGHGALFLCCSRFICEIYGGVTFTPRVVYSGIWRVNTTRKGKTLYTAHLIKGDTRFSAVDYLLSTLYNNNRHPQHTYIIKCTLLKHDVTKLHKCTHLQKYLLRHSNINPFINFATAPVQSKYVLFF